MHTAGESSKATVTCTEFVNQKRRSHALQQLTQQPESNTLSRKRAPSRLKVPAETPSKEPVVPKRSRPADPVQDPDPAESSVARPTGSAGAALLLVAAAVQDVDESTDEMGTPETHDDAGRAMTTGAETAAPAESQKKRRRRPKGRGAQMRKNETSSTKYAPKQPRFE